MQFTIPSVLFALLAVLSTAWSTMALPILQSRDVITPHITFPNARDVFQAGQTIVVTWDTSAVPANSPNQGIIVLGRLTSTSENLDINHPLAEGFPLTAGHQEITFPADLPTQSNYIIDLFGDSGNISGQFTIQGY